MPSVVWYCKGGAKSPTNCSRCGHDRGGSKLGKIRIIADANIRLVRNAAFLNRIFTCIPSEIERCNLFIYYLSLKGHSELIAKDPFCAGAAFKRVFSGRQ